MEDIINVTGVLNKPLPCEFGPIPKPGEAETYIKALLEKELPRSEQGAVTTDLKWNFVLEKHSVDDQKPKSNRKKKKFLTRKERKTLNLLKLPKENWNYKSLENMRQMWREYMRENLELTSKVPPSCEDSEWASFSIILAKSELLGAEITVIRSKNNYLVDTSGTIVLETRETFQIVTPKSKLKILIKKDSVFSFELDGMKFTFFGKHLVTRPAERSVKKIKSLTFPDL